MSLHYHAICMILISDLLLAYTPDTNNNNGRDWEILLYDLNNIELYVSNFGKMGPGWWPPGSGHNYIFGAGLWFGALDRSNTDTSVTIGYGPHGGETEFKPGLKDQDELLPYVRIYIQPEPWPAPLEYFPMAPQNGISDRDAWCCYNDCDPAYHMPGDTKPIGIEVYQTIYGWTIPYLCDVVFTRYDIKNVSADALYNCYFGLCMDNDIGYESGTEANDRMWGIIGRWYIVDGESLWVDDVGFQWQEVPEAGWAEFPGAIGCDFLQSPWDLVPGADKDHDSIPDEHETDSVWYCTNLPEFKWDTDYDGVLDWRDPSQIPQVGLNAFKRFTLNLEPNKDNERYMTLAGYNFKTGEYCPYDTIPPAPDDQRFLMACGPVDIMPDSLITVVYAIIVTEWYEGIIEIPDTAIVKIDYPVQYCFDRNWIVPGPPPAPHLSCVPGDKQVTLVWDDLSEKSPDRYYDFVHNIPSNSPVYDPFYTQYDFQGYCVYKSRNALPGTWEKLAACDLYDDVMFTKLVDGETMEASNTGVVHSHTDTDVRNGFTYYYGVTAFDWNRAKETDSTWNELVFESGYLPVSTVPRREPANYVPGSFIIESDSGNPAIANNNIDVKITYPLQMTADPIYLEFGLYELDTAKRFDPLYNAYLVDNAGDRVDSCMMAVALDTALTITSAPYEFKIFHGLSVSPIFKRYDIPSNVSIFDTVMMTGTYPESLVAPRAIATNWAYRGNDYEVTWIKAHGSDSVNSVTVVDLMTGETIPFKAGVTDTLADGWCFRKTTAPQFLDTLVYAPGAAPNGTRQLYICGGEVNLKNGSDLKAGNPRPGQGDVWTVHADRAYLPAPINARVKITSTPAVVLTDSNITLNVKVVPNPYIITNEWQQSFRLRRLRFINLPSTCTVRIFNLNGELVKTLTHTNNTTSSSGSELPNFNGGDEWWDLLSENRQLVASGIYVFHVQSDVGEQVGKFVVIR